MAKCYASEFALQCAAAAIQIYGGYGFTDEYPVSRYFRDTKVLEIGGDHQKFKEVSFYNYWDFQNIPSGKKGHGLRFRLQQGVEPTPQRETREGL